MVVGERALQLARPFHLHFDLGFDGLANLKLAIGDMYNDVGHCFGFSEFIFESLVICDV